MAAEQPSIPADRPPRRADVLATLAAHRDELRQLRVRSLAVFGSVARDEARVESDVDILVEFERPAGLFELARLQRYLETILGRSVDLGTPDSLRCQLRDQILAEAVRAT